MLGSFTNLYHKRVEILCNINENLSGIFCNLVSSYESNSLYFDQNNLTTVEKNIKIQRSRLDALVRSIYENNDLRKKSVAMSMTSLFNFGIGILLASNVIHLGRAVADSAAIIFVVFALLSTCYATKLVHYATLERKFYSKTKEIFDLISDVTKILNPKVTKKSVEKLFTKISKS